MYYKIALVATRWWLKQMNQRCNELYPNKVIFKNSEPVIIDDCLKNELARFEKALFAYILSHLENQHYLSLTCYFWPSGDLGILVRKTSISKEYFPYRAQMEIYDNSIFVSLDGEEYRKLPLPTKNL